VFCDVGRLVLWLLALSVVVGVRWPAWCSGHREKKNKKSSTVVAVGVRVLVAGCDDWHVLWWPECSVVAGKVAAAIGKKFPAI
jgi:hypothetical protein